MQSINTLKARVCQSHTKSCQKFNIGLYRNFAQYSGEMTDNILLYSWIIRRLSPHCLEGIALIDLGIPESQYISDLIFALQITATIRLYLTVQIQHYHSAAQMPYAFSLSGSALLGNTEEANYVVCCILYKAACLCGFLNT